MFDEEEYSEEKDIDNQDKNIFEKKNEKQEDEFKDEYLNIKHSVRPVEANDLEDINSVRNALEKTGDYKGVSDSFYERSFMDKPLEVSIRKFQKDNGLEEDGVLRPKGETEQSINEKQL